MIWMMGTQYNGRSGDRDWSETTQERKVIKGSDRWHAVDADRTDRFGPYSGEVKRQVAAHWALGFRLRGDLPPAFGEINQCQFTGAPFVAPALAACFADHADGGVELLPIERFWSVVDDARIEAPYVVANIYRTAETFDPERTRLTKLSDPRHGKEYSQGGGRRPQDLIVRPDAQGDAHVWRDAYTGHFFCDDTFRAAVEAVAPDVYEFKATTPNTA